MEVHGTEVLISLRALPGMPALGGHRTLRVAANASGVASDWREVLLYDGRPLGAMQASGAAPETWHDQVIYQVVLDRFANGDPTNDAPVSPDSVLAPAQYHGGDLAGLLAKLREGYFRDLGVSTLWISPVYANPDRAYREYPPPHRMYTGYHGYWPVRPREVDEHLGDVRLLREAVDEAHAQGLRVLLDFVANHTHEEHPYFRDHRDWFGTLELPDGSLNLRRWDDYRLTTWFEPYLPSFDYEAAPEAVRQMTADAVWWLRETGADGFRHDAVKHVPSGFWRALTARLRAELPERDLYQIGETFGSYGLVGSYVVPGQFDAQFNFNQYDVAIAALARGGRLSDLAGAVEEGLRQFGPLHLMGNLLDSHDKTRFLAILEGDVPPEADAAEIGFTDPPVRDEPGSLARLELGLAYVLTVPGVPVLYYGDEIGMTGAADPDNRRDMRFDVSPEEAAHRDRVAALVHLRRELPALRHGTYETMEATDTLWVFRRDAPGQTVVVALNTGAEPAEVTASGDWASARDAFDEPARVADAPIGPGRLRPALHGPRRRLPHPRQMTAVPRTVHVARPRAIASWDFDIRENDEKRRPRRPGRHGEGVDGGRDPRRRHPVRDRPRGAEPGVHAPLRGAGRGARRAGGLSPPSLRRRGRGRLSGLWRRDRRPRGVRAGADGHRGDVVPVALGRGGLGRDREGVGAVPPLRAALPPRRAAGAAGVLPRADARAAPPPVERLNLWRQASRQRPTAAPARRPAPPPR